MPIELKHPGVYIEEVPSGERTITGVATSTAAFIGKAPRGPVDEPVTITSYGEYERTFGGLWKDSSLGFAVRDFYANGGTTAIIVRLVAANATPATLQAGDVSLSARSAGAWGNLLSATVTDDANPDLTGVTDPFNLLLFEDIDGPQF